jgi:LysM repeat protein
VRLTRRGRLVVFLGALLVVLAVGVFWGAGSVATEQPGTPEPTTVVVVGEGETLWGIASEAATDGNTGAMVERIERLNHLESGMLTAGQKIRVPTD